MLTPPSLNPFGTPRSFTADWTFQNEYDDVGGGDPHSVHSPDGRTGMTEARAGERRYPSQYITVTALPPAATAAPSLLWMQGGHEKAVRAGKFSNDEMESSAERTNERKRRRSESR